MTSILTRQISIGSSSKAALQGETTLHKSWPLPCVSVGDAVTLGRDAVIVLLLESAEPLPLGSSLLVQVYEAVRKGLGRDPIELSKTKARMERAIQDANELALREMASASAPSTHRISLMLAAFLPAGDASCDVMIGHVGACRAFLRRHHHILPLTTPHTWGQENATSGIISAGDEENESKYPYWRRPTRWLGAAQKVAVDFTLEASHTDALVDATANCVKLQRDDSIFLCSSRLTATSLEKERDRIDARSVSALAQQLTERAALPGGNGAAAVAVGWSSKLGLIPIIAAIIILVLLAIVAATVSPTGGVDPTEVASKASQEDTNGSPEPSPPATDTSAPIAGASSTPMPTPPSPPPPLAIAAPPTRTTSPIRAPTATPAPITTPITAQTPTATPTPQDTATAITELKAGPTLIPVPPEGAFPAGSTESISFKWVSPGSTAGAEIYEFAIKNGIKQGNEYVPGETSLVVEIIQDGPGYSVAVNRLQGRGWLVWRVRSGVMSAEGFEPTSQWSDPQQFKVTETITQQPDEPASQGGEGGKPVIPTVNTTPTQAASRR